MKSRFRILGSTRLRIGDQFDDQWGPPKLRGILAVLLLHPGRRMSIDALIDWVWPEGKAPREAATFYTYAKRIREVLNRMTPAPKLVTAGGTYRIEVDREEIDFFEFRAAIDQARSETRQGDHNAASMLLTAALDMWMGTPLADLQGWRARDWRQWAQHDLLIPAHDMLLQALSAQGKLDEVLHRLADLPVEHQSNLMLVKRRLEALHGLHRSKEATTFYLNARKRLTSNFDHDEADELKRFHDRLMRHQPSTTAAAGEVADTVVHVPHLLPHDIRDFTGRELLLRQLDAMATTITGDLASGVVVLDGPPGVGKTALAVHWAYRVASRFPGGQLYVNLNGFANGPRLEPAEAVDGFLTALGFPVERLHTAGTRAAKLRSLLAGRRVLAVLDNAGDSQHVLPLLECLSGCLVVVTSRRRLSGAGRRGALNLSVPPLTYQEAKSWLARRVGDRAPVTPDAIDELASLCHGSPLALRGVADHVATRPRVRLSEFVDELRDTRNLLGLGDDGDSDDSVRTVFSWSYQTLASDQQRLFRLLGLHPGPDFSLNSAAALAGQDKVLTKRTLDVLVNAHLLTQPESRDRFRFHDLFRTYAAECATEPEHSDERAAGILRMLSFYLHSANSADAAAVPYRRRAPMPDIVDKVDPLTFANDGQAIDWCLRERANIGAIVRYAGQSGAHEYAYILPSATGEILQRLGCYDDVLANQAIAIRSARAVGDLQGEGYSLNNLGIIHLKLRRFDHAESAFRAAKARFDQTGFRFGSAAVMSNQARLQVARGEIKSGIEVHLTALTAMRQAEPDGFEVNALCYIAEAYRQAGNLNAAASYVRDSVWLAAKLRDTYGEGSSLTELGSIHYEQGDLTSAKGYLIRALELTGRIRATIPACKALNVLATIHRDERDSNQAEHCAQLALTFARKVREPRAEATALITIAELAYAQARPDDAAAAWSSALAILEDMADPQADAIRVQLEELPANAPPVPATRTEPLAPRTAQNQR